MMNGAELNPGTCTGGAGGSVLDPPAIPSLGEVGIDKHTASLCDWRILRQPKATNMAC